MIFSAYLSSYDLEFFLPLLYLLFPLHGHKNSKMIIELFIWYPPARCKKVRQPVVMRDDYLESASMWRISVFKNWIDKINLMFDSNSDSFKSILEVFGIFAFISLKIYCCVCKLCLKKIAFFKTSKISYIISNYNDTMLLQVQWKHELL